MATIPENEVTQADLNEWYRLQQELGKLKSAESLLRRKIFKAMFPEPKEGTNTIPLAEGWVLKGKHTINRSIDEGSLQQYIATDESGASEFSRHGLHVSKLIRWKPELVLREYKELTEEERLLFDNVLVFKDGSPALEIVLPKRASAKTE